MTAKADPYSRFYWRFINEFGAVYDDDVALATWLRLLVVADGTWPSYPPLPAGVDEAALATLIDAGLVMMASGHRYRVRGLDAERERRSARGVPGAMARWSDANANAMRTHPNGNANGNAAALHDAMPDETRRDEKRRAIRAQERVDAGEFLTFAQALEAVRAEKVEA